MAKTKEFLNGVALGMPIALGYVPVSFSFGMLAVAAGIPPWAAIIISMTNLTSAGQFAGLHIIAASGGMWEMAVTTFVINLRYMFMSLSLSQKTGKMPLIQRLITAFGITDEIFAVASTTAHRITFPFMSGLIATPYIGWALGTALGAFMTGFLPPRLSDALGITLYAMFIAIILPAARRDKAIIAVLIPAAAVSAIIYSAFPFISSGWSVIIASVAAAAIGASLFPRSEEDAS